MLVVAVAVGELRTMAHRPWATSATAAGHPNQNHPIAPNRPSCGALPAFSLTLGVLCGSPAIAPTRGVATMAYPKLSLGVGKTKPPALARGSSEIR